MDYINPDIFECALDDFATTPFTFVIFGGAGDLSKKKLIPTLYHLYDEDQFPHNFLIIGCGSPAGMDTQGYIKIAEESVISNNGENYKKEKFDEFSKHLSFLGKRIEEDELYENLKDLFLKTSPKDENSKIKIVFYMAVPPSLYKTIITKLIKFQFNQGVFETKVIIEKPFGNDFKSSFELNQFLTSVFRENQIYRIDHYLGKETLQNIIFFRFSNSIFEPLWNRRYIDNVQITVAEDIGIENRGKFYEKACVVRDIVQNHIMQIMALIAMEPPVGFGHELIRDEKVKVYKSINIMTPQAVRDLTIRGQYGPGIINEKKVSGYRSESFVSSESNTATFFAGCFMINNWRWAGVPFYVRTGKRLAKRTTEIIIEFKQPPLQLFKNECGDLLSSALCLKIFPEESITLRFGVKYPNTIRRIQPVRMNFSYAGEFNTKSFPPYSRLILDCLKGDLTLFVRQDEVETTWKIVDPILKEWENYPSPEFPNYVSGSEGPKEADILLQKFGHRWLTGLS